MSETIRIVAVEYPAVDEAEIARLEELIRDIRSGQVTGFAWVSAGPEFARYGGGFVSTRMDRLAIMAALTLKLRQVQDSEIELTGM